LKEWFAHLYSRNGLCCAFADGVAVQDVDWDTQGGHYRVRLQGQWLVVPDAAVVTEPNRVPGIIPPRTRPVSPRSIPTMNAPRAPRASRQWGAGACSWSMKRNC